MEIANKILAIIATFLLCCAFAIFLVYGAIISGLNSKAVSEFDKTYLEKIDSGVLVVDYGVNCLGYENEKTTSFFIGSTEFPLSRYYYSPCIGEGNMEVDILKIPVGTELDIYKTSWSQWTFLYCIVPQGYKGNK
jgi:hypothetical protein